ncbi:MAG: hypothetical protein MUP47_04620, partial [Phycisphaerae bacterium]|nr:hypothetical protein [Phycisphaerae bacterium]
RIPPHLHVIKEATVRQWILASDFVTSSYSTTLIEAAMAGKPILMQAPLPLPDYLYAEWYDYTPAASSVEEFLQAVQRCDATSGRALQQWAEREMLSRGDAIANIADLLAAVRRRERPAPGPPGIGILATMPKEKLPQKVRRILARTYRGLTRRPSKIWEADRITPEDLRLRLDKWATVLG